MVSKANHVGLYTSSAPFLVFMLALTLLKSGRKEAISDSFFFFSSCTEHFMLIDASILFHASATAVRFLCKGSFGFQITGSNSYRRKNSNVASFDQSICQIIFHATKQKTPTTARKSRHLSTSTHTNELCARGVLPTM